MIKDREDWFFHLKLSGWWVPARAWAEITASCCRRRKALALSSLPTSGHLHSPFTSHWTARWTRRLRKPKAKSRINGTFTAAKTLVKGGTSTATHLEQGKFSPDSSWAKCAVLGWDYADFGSRLNNVSDLQLIVLAGWKKICDHGLNDQVLLNSVYRMSTGIICLFESLTLVHNFKVPSFSHTASEEYDDFWLLPIL